MAASRIRQKRDFFDDFLTNIKMFHFWGNPENIWKKAWLITSLSDLLKGLQWWSQKEATLKMTPRGVTSWTIKQEDAAKPNLNCIDTGVLGIPFSKRCKSVNRLRRVPLRSFSRLLYHISLLSGRPNSGDEHSTSIQWVMCNTHSSCEVCEILQQ